MTTPPEWPAKAKLYKLKETAAGTAEKPPTVTVDGDPIHVQFNPTSLKLDRTNDTSGGVTTRAQRRNRPNEGHATLTLDLEFDTAEGGPDGQPLDVRKKTADIRQFAEPPTKKPQSAPPRIRFEWGTFRFDGIVSRLGEEIDYFSADGMALRAKLSLTITGQDAMFESNASGPGARNDSAATAPGGAPENSGPNAGPTKNPTQAVAAQDGESLQQLLARLNADPAAWRTAMAGLSSPLSLSAGAEVQLGASASVGGGIGVSAGFSAGASVGFSADASAGLSAGVGVSAGVGLSASAGVAVGGIVGGVVGGSVAGTVGGSVGGSVGGTAGGTVGFAAEADAGFALSAGGGVAASVGRTLARDAGQAVATARGSFDVPGSAAVAAGVGISVTATATASSGTSIDRRTVGYGYGVPLRPRITPAAGSVSAGASAGLSARAEVEQRDRDARPGTMRWSP